MGVSLRNSLDFVFLSVLHSFAFMTSAMEEIVWKSYKEHN